LRARGVDLRVLHHPFIRRDRLGVRVACPAMSASPGTLSLTDGQRLDHIRTKVNAWQNYVGQPHPALAGSSVAADDALFDVLPLGGPLVDRVKRASR
jgi:hypothetical protein